MISIITATKDSEHRINVLIDSLESQTDQDFEWIVADGGSTDLTINKIKNSKIIDRTKFVIREDFGIYDALNGALKLCTTEFYLVLGDDDQLYPDAISVFKQNCTKKVDFVASSILVGKTIVYPEKSLRFLNGAMAYVAGHAVGLAIRLDLHRRHGYYSNRYPIVADQLFILQAIDAGARLKKIEYTAGIFSRNGVSSNSYYDTQAQFMCVQILTGQNKLLQTFLFFLRSAKHLISELARK